MSQKDRNLFNQEACHKEHKTKVNNAHEKVVSSHDQLKPILWVIS
jgi:hypothetical protein